MAFRQRIAEVVGLIRGSRTLKWVPIPPVRPDAPSAVTVIYEKSPPLWAKWAHVIVALDVMMVTSIIEYTWNISGASHPSKPVPQDQSQPAEQCVEAETVPQHLAEHLQLQPVWKKTIFSGMFVLSGAMFGAAILASRSRVLRALTFSRGGTGAKRPGTLYLQTASHTKGFGIALPVEKCSIISGQAPSRLLIKVTGMGVWQLDLNEATINGKKPAKGQIDRIGMLRTWNSIGGRVAPLVAKSN
ncbi:hypothetical protein BDN70DRAFT_849185 [Pholiota conissans]|uniref:Uncharacterized protein n=1 Tax=Pholiota conissans TaxID=109636 RepID=A0A9P6D5K9_9AGAR|nr:hypothetical protein BDN70DRAFT_849185 [Pholiota conissans]